MLFKQHRPVPPLIAVLFGEFFYNLRAALDYCAYATAVVDSQQDPPPNDREIQFPIYPGPEGFAVNHHRIHPLSEKHQAWLEAVQPYAGGDDLQVSPLYWINELARRDRHRQLHVVGAYVIRSSPMVRSSRPVSVTFEDLDPFVFVEGETEIARFQVAPYIVGDHVEANPNSALNIEILEFARQRPKGVDWLSFPLGKRLFVIEAFVDSIIGQFESDCLGSTRSKFFKKPGSVTEPAQ